MRSIRSELKEKLSLPCLASPHTKFNQNFNQKADVSTIFKLSKESKMVYLTRYNKKFWESGNKENQHNSQNLRKSTQGNDDRFRSHKSKNYMTLDMIEINDFDDKMKNDIENIDRWVFNNLKKMSLPVSVNKNKVDQVKKNINMDIQMLNFIIQTSQQNIDSSANQPVSKRNPVGPGSNDLRNKIAITSETLNNEYNKSILIELIKKKIVNHDEHKKMDESYNMMLAKMIASDLVASFKSLHAFRHQNILRLKEVLETISEGMESVRLSIVNEKHNDCVEDYNFYEKTLKNQLRECDEDIKTRKDVLKKLLDSIRQKKLRINSEKQRFVDFAQMLEDKENETNKNRKIGEKMKLREFMEINEYKSKKIKLEAAVSQEIKILLNDINEINKKIERLEKEVVDLKFKKTWFIFKLKEFYLDFLLNEEMLIKMNKNLVTVVRNIWNLDEEVFVSSFSKFYEKEDINFILKYAKIHNEFSNMRAESNSMKKEIKNSLKKKFDEILNEDEYQIISGFKDYFKSFKNAEIKLIERRKVVLNKRSTVYKYCEVDSQKVAIVEPQIMISKPKQILDADNLSSSLSQLSEKLSHLKEQHIKVILERTVDKNNRSKLLGFVNSEYMKKIFTLMFGYQEAQIISQKLLKNSEIQIVPI